MKIGIVTVYDSLNLGSYLQAYALGSVLKERDNEVYYIKGGNSKIYANQIKKSLISSIKYGPNVFIKTVEKCIFNIRDIKLLEEVENANGFDLVFLGSDEIWNINKEKFRNTLFWGNVPGIKKDRIVPYAVSCGNSTRQDFFDKSKYIDLMNEFNYIMVRDKNSYDIVSSCTETNVSIVCDPTLLVDWQINDTYDVITNNDVIVYGYYFDEHQKKAIKEYARRKQKRIVAISLYQNWCHNINISALDFPSAVSKAYAVVTNTFHGTLFSMLYATRFISLANSIKVIDLAKTFKVQDKVYSQKLNYDILNQIITVEIDRIKLTEVLNEKREYSMSKINEVIDRE